MKICVVGSGISGLSAAYYLSKKNSVDLFESENHFGGHSHTINISYEEKKQIDVRIKKITKTRLNDRASSSWVSLRDLKKQKLALKDRLKQLAKIH